MEPQERKGLYLNGHVEQSPPTSTNHEKMKNIQLSQRLKNGNEDRSTLKQQILKLFAILQLCFPLMGVFSLNNITILHSSGKE